MKGDPAGLENGIRGHQNRDQPEQKDGVCGTMSVPGGRKEQAANDGNSHGEERRAQAIDLAIFKLKMLGCYVYKSRRTLNDLRILRRLILNERLSVESVIATM